MDQSRKLRDNFKQPESKKGKTLRTKKSSLILEDTNPNHAYGPNYYMLPRELKVYYKYIRLRKFVHVKVEDEKEIIKFNYFFYFGIIASIFGVYNFSRFFNKFVLKKISNPTYRHVKKLPVAYFGVPASLAGSLTYGYLNVYFVKNYCYDFMDKYRDEAIQNGFDDYDISEDKMKHSWTNYYHIFKL